MDFEFYVFLFNGVGCELSCEGFNDMEDVKAYIKDELIVDLYAGDSIKIKYAEDV